MGKKRKNSGGNGGIRRGSIIHKKKKKETVAALETIGVAGNERGCGCTHTALAIAQYKAVVCGRRTAYIEYTKQHHIEGLARLFGEGQKAVQGFTLNEMDFFFDFSSKEEMLHIWKMGYECIVIDFGVDWKNRDALQEYTRCGKNFLVCDLCDWKKQHFLKEMEQEEDEFHIPRIYLTPGNREADAGWARQKTGRQVCAVGYIKDPFQLEKKDVQKIRVFLGAV